MNFAGSSMEKADTVQESGFESCMLRVRCAAVTHRQISLTRMIMFDHAGTLSTSQVSGFYEKMQGRSIF